MNEFDTDVHTGQVDSLDKKLYNCVSDLICYYTSYITLKKNPEFLPRLWSIHLKSDSLNVPCVVFINIFICEHILTRGCEKSTDLNIS